MPDTPTAEQLTESLSKAEQERDEHKTALEKATEQLTKAQKDAEDLTVRVAELEKAAKPEDQPQPLDKSALPEPVRLALEKAEADARTQAERLEKAEKHAEESDKLAKAERDERLTRDFIAKAELFKALPFKAAEFGPVLKSASEKLSKDQFAELERVLTAADEQIAKGDLFKEQGSGGDGTPADGLDEMTRKAEELRKSDPSLSQYEAMNRARLADRAAQERYLAGVR